MNPSPLHLTAAMLLLGSAPALARDEAPRRVRVALGAELVPDYPGADHPAVQPLVDIATARGNDPFAFEAADESFGPTLIRTGRVELGPSLNVQGSRTAREVGAPLPRIGITLEVGGFVQYQLTPAFRLRGEVRQGLGGHHGLVANLSADRVWRNGDRWLFALGPRVTLAGDRYMRAYFGVDPGTAAKTGLRPFNAGGGVSAVGLTGGGTYQLNRRWGLYGYAKYERLVGDAARSPLVRRFGDRNQVSGGLALTYTFTRR